MEPEVVSDAFKHWPVVHVDYGRHRQCPHQSGCGHDLMCHLTKPCAWDMQDDLAQLEVMEKHVPK